MSKVSPTKRWRKSDFIWLLMALVVHFGLLFIPLTQSTLKHTDEAVLTISLQAYVEEKISATAEEAPPEKPQETMEPAAAPDIEPEPVQTLVEEIIQSSPIDPPHTEAEEDLPNAAVLMDSISSIEIEETEAETALILGRTYRVSTPANWREGTGTGAARYIDNWFEGMAVPGSTEIVDRWLANDGSQNVVVNLPNGMTVCGRREASDPLRPMIEHLMMFQPCGGGGKRTFSMDRAESRTSVASSRESPRR